jgi:DtxR family Mn-dependent transcriptional regulator
MALKIVRRHRLWEMYLVKFLGFSWDQIHDEAERLEHVTSEALEKRIDHALGYPSIDPHGDPIPTGDGELHHTAYNPLAECSVGDVVRVQRVSDAIPELLQHASALGLSLNSRLTVRQKRNFDGSMVVKVGSREQFISREVAAAIFVQPV